MKRIWHTLFGHRYFYVQHLKGESMVTVYECTCGARLGDLSTE